MPLDPTAVGTTSPEWTVTWTDTESLLYALAVGAGQQDPLAELALTTENTTGVAQQVVPSFAVVLGFGQGMPDIGDYDPTRAVHAEQQLEVDGPVPPAGSATVSTTVTEMWDKGRDAIVWTETVLRDADTGDRLALSRTGAFLGGAGGFGGERGTTREWSAPDRVPDHRVDFATRPEQALLYRLTGDRNPLHADPAFAARGGFERPILHGMCTYGYAARLLVHAVCESDASRLAGMEGRFTRPVLPGDALALHVWRTSDDEAAFRVVDADGHPVIDRGRAFVRTA
ncbi:MaoC/PaaZ C-terminal domain-containing protein [Nocardioides hwasunensis]|uniref:MaoC family dehydratase N-terminal domain-containing protein n=1 Tax=Nocardioides hwasunensis TaxID=397258 RepID=A0ABR8MHR9_9ACTN|nr:MaoC/PaaZ C-terminal domain-containing protein [Nocardioides hwasunensis]MBD3915612.1 MaoC family dehydratase N-terminal domain-containing protein [Nocardioides hwasunensis]